MATSRSATRLVVAVPLSLGGFPLLALFAYLLVWWSAALGAGGSDPCDPALAPGACPGPEERTFWIVAAATFVPAAACLVLSLTRLRTARRWWPLPVAAVLLGLACMQALNRIS